ncbi:MAG TPA: hypothetical protein VGP82_21975 [Ktedonobacterales bacterium]|jgi:hypothetical protein|nr:hypothetical protein [Ktedonobacterales bacterium]
MVSTQHRPLSRGSLVGVTALSLALWMVTGLFVLYFNVQSSQCPATETGVNRCGLLGLFSLLVLLVGVAAGAGAFAVIWALSAALDARDAVSAAASGVLLAAVAIAIYALLQNGHPGHPFLTALYGFPPDGLSLHPVAYYGSAALVVLLPLLVLPYALTRGRMQRVSAAAGPLLVLGFWLAIRLAG